MPPKSIFRQPGARHFQLVHRSQRDPLIHDPGASQRVLKLVERSNAGKGKSRADLERSLLPSELNAGGSKIGEAAVYGIYYDDTEYDYMQHLRSIGVQEDLEGTLLETPPTTRLKTKADAPAHRDDIPPEALPSTFELPRNYELQEAVPSSISGLQPDMDPHLRQTLEALEDDAFVDEELEDDYFKDLVADGERAANDEFDYEFRENGVEEGTIDKGEADEGWEARYAAFKKGQVNKPVGSELDALSEEGDTVGCLPALSVIGGKRRRKGASDASGYSMSSSSLSRTEALQILDERFDRIMEKEYGDLKEIDERGTEQSEDSDNTEAPDLINSRADFQAMVDDFINNFEIIGRKMKPKLEGEDFMDRLNTARQALRSTGHDMRVDYGESDGSDDVIIEVEEDETDRWDCETILTTYTNLENHPRLIRARERVSVPRIRLDPKSGLPSVASPAARPRSSQQSPHGEAKEDKVQRPTLTRPRHESKEEKKLRKRAVKEERQVRRRVKKATKEQFNTEALSQMKAIANRENMNSLRRLQ